MTLTGGWRGYEICNARLSFIIWKMKPWAQGLHCHHHERGTCFLCFSFLVSCLPSLRSLLMFLIFFTFCLSFQPLSWFFCHILFIPPMSHFPSAFLVLPWFFTLLFHRLIILAFPRYSSSFILAFHVIPAVCSFPALTLLVCGWWSDFSANISSDSETEEICMLTFATC